MTLGVNSMRYDLSPLQHIVSIVWVINNQRLKLPGNVCAYSMSPLRKSLISWEIYGVLLNYQLCFKTFRQPQLSWYWLLYVAFNIKHLSKLRDENLCFQRHPRCLIAWKEIYGLIKCYCVKVMCLWHSIILVYMNILKN